jgi:ABC-type transport system involved in cytochrome c biogenesis ATPase subunit
MRAINEHKVNPANDRIEITVVDEPGAGGACHEYHVSWDATALMGGVTINFQNGPIAEVGVNGITHEALLAIIADRLRAFQAGPYACRENAIALTKIEEAQHWLHHRTLARMARGVEGTHKL